MPLSCQICVGLALVLASEGPIGVFGAGDELVEPAFVSSVDGLLSTSLNFERTSIETPDYSITSRTFNGTIPGPTLLLQAGDTIILDFHNLLADQGSPFVNNRLSAPDETNLHFHGLFVSGELPSDDTTLVIGAGESYQYMATLPQDHFPGTHWLHPHRHGSTTLQVGGGAAAAIIVQDPPGFLPAVLEEAREILMVVHQLYLDTVEKVAERSQDGLFATDSTTRYNTVNGQVQPVLRFDPGEWVRLRVIYAAWENDAMRFRVDGCEMQLLAKDGVYIRDFPREIREARLFLGGRADIMVRCAAISTQYDIIGSNAVIATVQTSEGPLVDSTSLPQWSPTYPPYLEDLRDTPASPGCSCTTKVSAGGGMNGYIYDEHQILHESYLGAVVERSVSARDHPYHQHVYPFQLVGGFRETEYLKIGDWHDTYDGNALIRYSPTEFVGKVMIHCHKLEHEDEGMMAIENVTDSGGPCVCGAVLGLSTWAIALIIVGSALVVTCCCAFGYLFWAKRRRRCPFSKGAEIQREEQPVSDLNRISVPDEGE